MGSDGSRNVMGNEVVLGDRSNDANAAREKFLERRRKSDWLVRAAIIMSVLAWLVMFSVWIVMYFAAENQPGIFNLMLQVDVPRNPLTATLLPIAYYMLLASLAICVVAFVFNKMRMRRKTDKYRKSIFIIAGITIIAYVAFVLNFGFLW
jgi:heme/copper-type cytochrome/quinol oxidase subunit 3